jgi:hypothetical protein
MSQQGALRSAEGDDQPTGRYPNLVGGFQVLPPRLPPPPPPPLPPPSTPPLAETRAHSPTPFAFSHRPFFVGLVVLSFGIGWYIPFGSSMFDLM